MYTPANLVTELRPEYPKWRGSPPGSMGTVHIYLTNLGDYFCICSISTTWPAQRATLILTISKGTKQLEPVEFKGTVSEVRAEWIRLQKLVPSMVMESML